MGEDPGNGRQEVGPPPPGSGDASADNRPSGPEDLVEALVYQVLEAPSGQRSRVLAELSREHPDQAGTLQRRLEHLDGLLARTPGGEEGFPRSLGDFELLRRLGAGGMGVVYLARNRTLGRMVALKVIRPELLQHSRTRKRFQREMQATAKLIHPNICPVYSAGTVGETPYIEMPLLQGATLEEHLRRCRQEAGSASEPCLRLDSGDKAVASSGTHRAHHERIAGIIRNVAEALHIAHRQGLVHRDVKPGNIMITDKDEPVLMDFGLARLEEEGGESLTLTGENVGTPVYMSPEQVDPDRREVDHRTDIYSLGVTLYECLTLRCPFQEPNRESLFRQIRETPPPDPLRFNPSLPGDLRAILETALDKDPARRYPTALALAEDLQRFLTFQPIKARRTSLGLRLRRWVQRNRVVSTIFTLVCIALVVTLFLLARVNSLSQSRRVLALVGAAAQEEGSNPTLSLLLALEAAELERSPAVLQQLRASLAVSRVKAVARGHRLVCWAGAFTPDGRHFLTGSQDGTIRTWDLEGRELEEVRIDVGVHVTGLAISPAGDRILATSSDGGATLWDRRGRLVKEVAKGDKAAIAPCFSPDGRRLAFACYDGLARVFDCRGVPVAEIGGHHPAPVRWVAFQPGDPDRLATAAFDGTAALWNLAAPERPLVICRGHTGQVHRVLFSPRGDRLLTLGNDCTARVWDLQGEELACLKAGKGWIMDLAWSPGGDRILTVSQDQIGRFWTPRGKLLSVLNGHTGVIYKCAFSPDGNYVATGSDDQTLRLWDRRGRQVAVLRGHTHQVNGLVRFSPDGSLVLSAAGDATARLWEVSDLGLPVLHGAGSEVIVAREVPGRKEVLTISRDGIIQLWDLSGRSIATFPSGHGDLITAVDLAPGGESLVTCSRDGTAKLWDLAGRKLAGTSPNMEGWLMSASFNGTGDRILLVVYGLNRRPEQQSRIEVRDRSWALCNELDTSLFAMPNLAVQALFLPGDRRVAVASEDGVIRILDLEGHEQARLQGHGNSMVGMALSPDGRFLLSAAHDKTARIWDIREGRETIAPLWHQQPLTRVSWSEDGRQVLTASRDGTARLWDRRGNLLSVYRLHRGAVWDVGFLADGRRLLTASADGTVRFWHRRSADLLEYARSRRIREFTREELDRFGGLLR